MLAAGDVTSYKQYIFYMPNIKYVLLIGHDVTRGKHHVMKSSRPSPSFLCLGSKVAIHLSRAGREKAWSRGYYGVRWSTCNLPVFKSVYTYKASKCKRAIIRLHCATSKSSLWYMEYVPRGGAFERPRIYRTSNSYTMAAGLYGIYHARPEGGAQGTRVINPIQARDRHGITILSPIRGKTIGFPGTVVKAAFCLGKDLPEWCSCKVC